MFAIITQIASLGRLGLGQSIIGASFKKAIRRFSG